MKKLSIYSNLSHNYLSCFYPVGFVNVENGSVAHLAEHYLFYMMKKYLIKENKMLGFYCNAFTTENYMGYWFCSRTKDFPIFRERFQEFVAEIDNFARDVDELVIKYEKKKIKSELKKINEEINQGKRRAFVSAELIKYETVEKCTVEDVSSFLRKYLEVEPLMISYGVLEKKSNLYCGNVGDKNVDIKDIQLSDNSIKVRNTSIHTRVLLQVVVSFFLRQLTSSCYLNQDSEYLSIKWNQKCDGVVIKQVIKEIEKKSAMEFYIYLDYIGKHESEKYCGKPISYLAEVYCCYASTNQVVSIADVVNEIYSITYEEFREILKKIGSMYE